MKIFLIVYDRQAGRVVEMREFAPDDRHLAESEQGRLEREKPGAEVVLLQAADEEALRRTHGRYFADLAELLKRINASERKSA
jgi:hypothetical protein